MIATSAQPSSWQHGRLDLVGDMGNDLDRAAQIFAAPLLGDHRVVDPAGGVVVLLAHDRVGVPLIMAHVEIGLGPVIGDVDLAVLEGVHGARIDVDVGVELLKGDGQAPAFQQRPDGGCSQPLAEGGEDAAGDENKLGLSAGLDVHCCPWLYRFGRSHALTRVCCLQGEETILYRAGFGNCGRKGLPLPD